MWNKNFTGVENIMDLDELIKKVEKEAIERYSTRFKNLGISPRSLGWGCKEDQLERFRVVLEQCKPSGKTLMDIGCGFSDLYVYLKEHTVKFNYIGVDFVPVFIEFCKKNFSDQKFYLSNIMRQTETLPKADIVVSLGTINFKLENDLNFKYSKYFITKAFDLAKEMLCVDFLSKYRIPEYPKEDFVYYHSPEDVFKFATSLTNNVRLLHNYKAIPQKEFMIILEK